MILGIIIGVILCLGVLWYLHKSGKLEPICTKVKNVLKLLKFLSSKK